MSNRLLDALRVELSENRGTELAAANLFERRSAFLTKLRVEHSELQMRALDRFQQAFDALELLIMLCGEIASDYEATWVVDLDPATDATTLALRNLFWSGHLIAGETLSLLRAGYTVGALARWRALHEVATQSESSLDLVSSSPDR
jgi:hypothetical protein